MPEPAIDPATFQSLEALGERLPDILAAPKDAGRLDLIVVRPDAGLREMPGMKLFLAYLRDPAGNKVCAMYRPG